MNKRRLFAALTLCAALSGCTLIPTLQSNLVALEAQSPSPSPSPTPDLVAQALDRGDVD